jgi:hypothetical protein
MCLTKKKKKNIYTKYRFKREIVNNDDIYLEFCKLKNQLVDIFTNPLERNVFEKESVEI